MSALRTRSLLSRTVASGRPTIANFGSPPVMWTSTCTGGASIPTLARLTTVASDIAGSRLVEETGASMDADRAPGEGRTSRAVSAAGACLLPRGHGYDHTTTRSRFTTSAPSRVRA